MCGVDADRICAIQHEEHNYMIGRRPQVRTFIWSCVGWAILQTVAAAQTPIYRNSLHGIPQRSANGVALAAAPQRPSWPPPSAKDEQEIDRLLNRWQITSQKIERYRCRFKRWLYDPVFGPRDKPHSYGEGRIEYASPDKGLYKTESLLYYTPAAAGENHATKPAPTIRANIGSATATRSTSSTTSRRS